MVNSKARAALASLAVAAIFLALWLLIAEDAGAASLAGGVIASVACAAWIRLVGG